MYKKLLLCVGCLCAVSGVWASEGKKEKVVEIKEETKFYRFTWGKNSVDVAAHVVALASGLQGFVGDQDDEESPSSEAGKIIVRIAIEEFLKEHSFLNKQTTFEDFKFFVECAQENVELNSIQSPQLVRLIELANFLGAMEGKDFHPKPDLMKLLCSELIAREKTVGLFDVLAEINALPNDIFIGYLNDLKQPIIFKEPKLLWEETISDQGMFSCVVSNGMIATAKIKKEKEGEFFVAEEVVLADPLNKQKTITLKGKFSFNDREVFNVLFLPQNQIAIITVDMIQVFDRKTTERTSFIAKPRKPELERIHSAPNFSDDWKIPAGYLSQNCAVVCADSTIVCTSDEGLFVWKVGAGKGTTIKVALKSYYPEGHAFFWYPFIYNSLPRLYLPGDVCITGLACLADNNVGIILHEAGVAIYNIEDCTLKCKLDIEKERYLGASPLVPSFSLITMSSGNIYYISNHVSEVFCCDKCQAKECKDDFFPEKPKDQWSFPFGRIIRDTVVLGGDIFAMNTTESDDKNRNFFGDYVKIGKSLRDVDVVIPVEQIKYQRFGDYRLFNVGNGRIMLEQHDRNNQKIHRKMWKVVVPVEGLSFEQVLFVRSFELAPQRFKEGDKETKASSTLERIFYDKDRVVGCCASLDMTNLKNNAAFFTCLNLSEDEGEALWLSCKVKGLLEESDIKKREEELKNITVQIKAIQNKKVVSEEIITAILNQVKEGGFDGFLLAKIAQLDGVLREYQFIERQIIAQEHSETLQQRKPGFWERMSNFWQKKPVVVEQQETVEMLKQKKEELWKKAETLEADIKQDAKLLEYGEDKILPFDTMNKIRKEKAKETQPK